jgi:hypothetical protein
MPNTLPDQAREIINALNLTPHPEEGGYFAETYRSPDRLDAAALPGRYNAHRCLGTAIYYLLAPGMFSAMHRLQSDEIFHLYAGGPVRMLQLGPEPGQGRELILGTDLTLGQRPQVLVQSGVWQGSILESGASFALLGCTVCPGFEYADYEHGRRDELLRHWPGHADLLRRLTQE